MIQSSEAYNAAITGDARRILLRAAIDIIDPDLTWGTVDSSGAASVGDPAQVHDKGLEMVPYATLEPNRWMLDGTFQIFPLQGSDHIGFLGDVLSAEDGTFDPAVWVEEQFNNVSILQACSIYFPTAEYDGYPVDFTVEVKQGGTAYFTQTFTGNTATQIDLDGFTVNNPDAIRVTVTKWSMGGRRLRVPEIIPGVYETWDGGMIATFSLTQQANFSCLALPYGTCTLRMDNLDRRFEPRNKNGVFRSIEERQGIPVSLGVRLPDGSVDYKPKGVYYQYSGGWKTGDNGLTMQWDLVDIIGLVSGRQYLPPSPLPTTLEGWVASIVAQLGDNFAGFYHVDPDYANVSVTANSVEDVSGISCGEVLRMACMAAGVFPRADDETGYLTAEPLWSQGSKLTLDNMETYPVMRANDDLAVLIFTLYDGSDNGTEYTVSGTATASGNTVSIQNPFIHTQAQALTAARLILSTYGGNQLEATGRGNPASEIGDVDVVWLNESSATTGRRMVQTFDLSSGVLKGCQSTLLQADGSFQFESREVITAAGTWTAPAGATRLRLILVGKGADGEAGQKGTYDSQMENTDGTITSESQGRHGADGADGIGGLVWTGTIDINPQQQFPVSFDAQGNTVFGAYSSANGQRYPYGFSDVASGDSYARTGVADPKPGSGDGGKGGEGGEPGFRYYKWTIEYDEDGRPVHGYARLAVDVPPGEGKPGVAGATGCVVVYWDKEETT